MTSYRLPPVTLDVIATANRQGGNLEDDQRSAYAKILRDFANKCREEGDIKNADFNDWVASNYERNQDV